MTKRIEAFIDDYATEKADAIRWSLSLEDASWERNWSRGNLAVHVTVANIPASDRSILCLNIPVSARVNPRNSSIDDRSLRRADEHRAEFDNPSSVPRVWYRRPTPRIVRWTDSTRELQLASKDEKPRILRRQNTRVPSIASASDIDR